LRKPQTARCCPICNWSGREFDAGGPPTKRRFDCRCPKCGSLERHRLAYLVATTRDNIDYSKVLHVAPELALENWLASKAREYLSIDLANRSMVAMDVTNLELDDNSKTLIWVSHVLEHVVDDKKAISEFWRVLAPDGLALVQVPIWTLRTIEDPSVSTPEKRLKKFYQSDHVRLYGLDITDRFEEAGFSSEIVRAQDFGPELLLKHGLSFASTDEVFLFRK
jgi:SAM-dependent methyltransferase